MASTSGLPRSQDFIKCRVIRKGTSVQEWKSVTLEDKMEVDVEELCFHSISSTSNTKKAKKRKAEDELATQLSGHEKRPRSEAVKDISLAGKSVTKALKRDGLRFLVPVDLSWNYQGQMRTISISALVDTGAEATIFDCDFVERKLLPWKRRETRLKLEGADGSPLKRSGIAQVQGMEMKVLDARTGKDRSFNLVAEIASLEPGTPLILGLDWLTEHCEKLVLTAPFGLELKRALDIQEVTDFSDFDEVLANSQYVGLIRIGQWESVKSTDGVCRRIMTISAAENLDELAARLSP